MGRLRVPSEPHSFQLFDRILTKPEWDECQSQFCPCVEWDKCWVAHARVVRGSHFPEQFEEVEWSEHSSNDKTIYTIKPMLFLMNQASTKYYHKRGATEKIAQQKRRRLWGIKVDGVSNYSMFSFGRSSLYRLQLQLQLQLTVSFITFILLDQNVNSWSSIINHFIWVMTDKIWVARKNPKLRLMPLGKICSELWHLTHTSRTQLSFV